MRARKINKRIIGYLYFINEHESYENHEIIRYSKKTKKCFLWNFYKKKWFYSSFWTDFYPYSLISISESELKNIMYPSKVKRFFRFVKKILLTPIN